MEIDGMMEGWMMGDGWKRAGGWRLVEKGLVKK